MITTMLILAAMSGFYRRHEGVMNLLAVAAIVNMPRGQAVLYCWLRSTLQSFIGSLKPHPDPAPEIVTPEPNPTVADAK